MSMWDGLFTAWRGKPGPTLYPSIRTAVTEDYTFWACITLVLILVVAYLLTILGLPKNEKLKSLFRFLSGATVAGFLLFCLYGQEWYSAKLYSRMEYSGKNSEINATVGIKVGLKQINVTLQGAPESQSNEQISYNEKFKMESYKSLGGSYKYHLKRGTPYPILWVGEYLAMDAGGVRFGRYYRIAGHYAYISLWTAFAMWMVTCVVYNINVRRAAYGTVLTGALVLTGVISYVIISPNTMRIPFRDGWLIVEKGWCFWLAVILGVLVILAGVTLVILDRFLAGPTAGFFSLQVEKSRHDTKRNTSIPSLKKNRSITPITDDTPGDYKKRPLSSSSTVVKTVTNGDLRKRPAVNCDPNGNVVSNDSNSKASDQVTEVTVVADLDEDHDLIEQELMAQTETN